MTMECCHRGVSHFLFNASLLVVGFLIGSYVNESRAAFQFSASKQNSRSSSRDVCSPILIESSKHLLQVKDFGDTLPAGACGPNENATFIHFTAARLCNKKPSRSPFNELQDVVTFHFRAYDNRNYGRSIGGDEFKLLLWATTNGTVFQTGAVSTDLMNGYYELKMLIPVTIDDYKLSLAHWYTCFDGQHSGCAPTRWHQCSGNSAMARNTITFGPIAVECPQLIINKAGRQQQPLPQYDRNERAPCEGSQQGIDGLTQLGYWFEDSNTGNITQAADWVPLCCSAPSALRRPTTPNPIVRIGDSTMPYQSLQVGFVYDGLGFQVSSILGGHSNKWYEFLLSHAPYDTDVFLNQTKQDDVMLFQAGLHQLHRGFHASASTEIIILMLCQIAAVFPGKIVILGPNPIQQHRFRQVDIRDLEVRILNAILRQRILEKNGGNLLDICKSSMNLTTLRLAPDLNGNIQTSKKRTDEEIVGMLKRLATKQNNASISVEPTELEQEFETKMSRIDIQTVYSNRTVWFTNVYKFLLPRDETYRVNDKIHDVKGRFFWTKHAGLMGQLAQLRSQGTQ